MNYWLLGISDEGREVMLEMGTATVEDFQEAQKAYLDFSDKLNHEEIRQKIVALLREKYAWLVAKRAKLEREYADARMKGVSYSQRASISGKIGAVERLLTQTRHLGHEWAKKGTQAKIPPTDVVLIGKFGLDWYLKYLYLPEVCS